MKERKEKKKHRMRGGIGSKKSINQKGWKCEHASMKRKSNVRRSDREKEKLADFYLFV